MLKKIPACELQVGMYIHDLDCGWAEHPFLRSRFMVGSECEIDKIHRAGIHGVVIDCNRGLDASNAPTLTEAKESTEAGITALAARTFNCRRVTLAEEVERATGVRRRATELVRTVMADARLGRAVELDQVGPVVESVTESVLRNPDALLGLLRIKNKDNYTFLHSVSVCALLVAFCRSREMDDEIIYQAGLGGLLHDIGKALVPDAILNKQGRLSEEEFEIIKHHPRDGYDILVKTIGIGEIPLDITLHHHERHDGSGYPERQSGRAIGELAQMAAIVDVYDAITSDRCYHKGMPAAEALRKIYEWSKFHFSPTLAQEFIRCIGIYPVGTLVLLESGRLGVVIEQHRKSLLTPKVNVFFNTRKQVHIRREVVDLSRSVGAGGADRIVRIETGDTWNIDPRHYLDTRR